MARTITPNNRKSILPLKVILAEIPRKLAIESPTAVPFVVVSPHYIPYLLAVPPRYYTASKHRIHADVSGNTFFFCPASGQLLKRNEFDFSFIGGEDKVFPPRKEGGNVFYRPVFVFPLDLIGKTTFHQKF